MLPEIQLCTKWGKHCFKINCNQLGQNMFYKFSYIPTGPLNSITY